MKILGPVGKKLSDNDRSGLIGSSESVSEQKCAYAAWDRVL